MSGIEYDGEASGPSRRSQWFVVGGLAAVVLVVVTRGVVAVLVLALVAVLVAVVVGLAAAAVRALRGGVAPSGDHPSPGLDAGGGPSKQRAEAGHVSPSASR